MNAPPKDSKGIVLVALDRGDQGTDLRRRLACDRRALVEALKERGGRGLEAPAGRDAERLAYLRKRRRRAFRRWIASTLGRAAGLCQSPRTFRSARVSRLGLLVRPEDAIELEVGHHYSSFTIAPSKKPKPSPTRPISITESKKLRRPGRFARRRPRDPGPPRRGARRVRLSAGSRWRSH